MPSRWLEIALRLPRHAAAAFLQKTAAPSDELNTVLFHNTFRIEGPSTEVPNQSFFGTAFVMRVPKRNGDAVGSTVLITAAHVFDHIGGNVASLLVRRSNPDESYTVYSHDVQIRQHGQPLYVRHHDADVAAMHVKLPNDVSVTKLIPDLLADDERLKSIEMHPGDVVFCLGFPFGSATPGGFPSLRTGYLASYPLTPQTIVKQILLDAAPRPGCSGGPAYYSYSDRTYHQRRHFGVSNGLLGLVARAEHIVSPALKEKDVELGIVVPAAFAKR
jgi:hypothetical protein